jgi:hypothetical protein
MQSSPVFLGDGNNLKSYETLYCSQVCYLSKVHPFLFDFN